MSDIITHLQKRLQHAEEVLGIYAAAGRKFINKVKTGKAFSTATYNDLLVCEHNVNLYTEKYLSDDSDTRKVEPPTINEAVAQAYEAKDKEIFELQGRFNKLKIVHIETINELLQRTKELHELQRWVDVHYARAKKEIDAINNGEASSALYSALKKVGEQKGEIEKLKEDLDRQTFLHENDHKLADHWRDQCSKYESIFLEINEMIKGYKKSRGL